MSYAKIGASDLLYREAWPLSDKLMKIRYQNTMEDLVAFNEHLFAHSPTSRRRAARERWGASLAAFVGVVLPSSTVGSSAATSMHGIV